MAGPGLNVPRMIELYLAYVPAPEMCLRLGVTWRTIRLALIAHEIPKRERRHLPRGPFSEATRERMSIAARTRKRERWAWPLERELRAVELYASGMNLAEIARLIGSNKHRVRDALCRQGVELRGQIGSQAGSKNPSWKGGQMIDKHGYILVSVPDHPAANNGGYVRQHRLVMEQMLGRYLLPGEVVHHRDSNTANNDPSNLELFASNADHLRHELTGRVPNWTPEGRARMREATDRKRKQPLSTPIQSTFDDLGLQ